MTTVMNIVFRGLSKGTALKRAQRELFVLDIAFNPSFIIRLHYEVINQWGKYIYRIRLQASCLLGRLGLQL